MKKRIKKSLIVFVLVICLGLCCCSIYTTPSESLSSDSSFADSDLSGEEQEENLIVKINENNGSEIKEYLVKKDGVIKKPENPVFDDNVFLGWFANGEEFNFSKPITENLEITALWEKVYDDNLSLINGEIVTLENGYKSCGGEMILANVDEDFDRGTIEVTVNSPDASDSGIIVCLENNGNASFWENGVSYYFFFINIEGNAYLGKVDNGSWTAEKVVPIENYNAENEYTLKVTLNGTDLYCYVNEKLYIAFSEYNFLKGSGYGVRTATQNVSFTNFSVSGKC